MNIRKKLAVVGTAVLMVGSAAMAELEVKPYGAVQYRYRGQIWTASDKDSSAATFDNMNLVAWHAGLRAKVDNQLSLEFRIGNDWTAGEQVTWAANNTVGGRQSANNLYVHLANARWNPGTVYMDIGVIPMSSNGTLDLLERSLNTGSYDQTVYQGWGSQTNNSLMAFRLGVPILKDDIKLAAELALSVIDRRTQTLTTGGDMAIPTQEPNSNPSSFLLVFNVPVNAGAIKVTPELTTVINRNYNRTLEKGDHEIIAGLSASYKVNDMVSLSLFGGYGTVSNENSQVGDYGDPARASTAAEIADFRHYSSNGLQVGVGTSIKAGPGTFAFDFRYGNSFNGAEAYTIDIEGTETTIDPKIMTNANNIYIDPRYTWNLHPRFTIAPRWRIYVTTYEEDRGGVTMKMENRPEITLGASF